MWPFKKKEVEPIEEKEIYEPEYKAKEDRFHVMIDKDANSYMIKVYDTWSSTFFMKDSRETGIMHCRETVMGNVTDYALVLKQIEENKQHLRIQFLEKRKKLLKPKKTKPKKKVMVQ